LHKASDDDEMDQNQNELFLKQFIMILPQQAKFLYFLFDSSHIFQKYH